MKYAILTPVGPQKLYTKKYFWDNIKRLQVKPSMLIMYMRDDVKEEFLSDVNVDTDFPIIVLKESYQIENDTILATTTARESIRREFIKHDIPWALWLDPDIIIPDNLIDLFLELKNEETIMINAWHPSRIKRDEIRRGISCTFVHLDCMCTIRDKNFGDDQIWLYTIRSFGSMRDINVISGVVFDLKHVTDKDDIHVFNEEIKKRCVT